MNKRPITTRERRLLKKIIARRNKDSRLWTWAMLANEFGFNSASHCYNWVHDRCAEINGVLVTKDDVAYVAQIDATDVMA